MPGLLQAGEQLVDVTFASFFTNFAAIVLNEDERALRYLVSLIYEHVFEKGQRQVVRVIVPAGKSQQDMITVFREHVTQNDDIWQDPFSYKDYLCQCFVNAIPLFVADQNDAIDELL